MNALNELKVIIANLFIYSISLVVMGIPIHKIPAFTFRIRCK
jgi:hypothetical protein